LGDGAVHSGTETEDEAERSARMAEILKYNEEDLAATWVVFQWLRGKLLG
jgi:predicted RecB family nuclease